MKFIIAPDSFKGNLTAQDAARAIQRGLGKVFPDADYTLVPMADGGEGTVQTLVDATDGQLIEATVLNSLEVPVKATYGILGDGKTAVIEMAAASGLQWVNTETMNPLITTTYGTGQLIKDALDHDVRRFIIGLGGSATNDGGVGMAEALGVRFLDHQNQPLARGGADLINLQSIDMTNLDPRLAGSEILLAADVTNPLIGDNGASAVFGPQKGATPAMVAQLDEALKNYAHILEMQLQIKIANVAGAGAAGGLGAGFLAFTPAQIRSGIDLVIDAVDLANKAQGADYAFVGEGSIDFQTQFGKAPMGATKVVKKVAPEAKVIGLAGFVGQGSEALYDLGMDAILSIVPGAVPLESALAESVKNLERTAENIARLIK